MSIPVGLAVGCEYLRGLAPVVPSAMRNNEESADLKAIYGVDLLLQNPDRRPEKPNCAMYRGGILAFDFELAFSFLVPLIGKQSDAWAVDEQGIATRHLFFAELRQRRADLDWTTFMQVVRSFQPERLAELFGTVPPEWQTYAVKVKEHLGLVRDHAVQFNDALIRSLV